MMYLSESAQQIFCKVIEQLQGEDYAKIDNSKGSFMPLTVERLYKANVGCVYSFCHYGEQNGDLMKDPDVVFLHLNTGEVAPMEFQNDYASAYDRVLEVRDGQLNVLDQRQYNSLLSFANVWMNNINEQQCLGVE